MKATIGKTLAELRKSRKLLQKDVAAKLSGYGIEVSSKTIFNWEKGLAQPNANQFLALCGILGVDDVLWQFSGVQRGPYAGLNGAGRQKARELIDLLLLIDEYKAVSVLGNDNEAPEDEPAAPRLLPLYDMPVSAGTGNFIDESAYDMITAPSYVPGAAEFALRVSGDSMEPMIKDGQIIWIKKQETLDFGEIGIFAYYDDVYCKELAAGDGKVCLRSLNPEYADIEINEDFGLHVIGRLLA